MGNRLNADKAFYRRVFATALPMMAQNAITMFVSLLDNLMVGQLSTAQIGGVTIINNNLIFIFNLCLFGGIAGAGIYTTQFYGSGDNDSIRYTFRFKLYISLLMTAIGTAVFLLFGDSLIGLYLRGQGDARLAADTLHYAKQYLGIMLWGLLPFALTTAYTGTLKVCGHPTVSMVASVCATIANLVGNWILIFGNLGAPAMGVAGAAVATVISRYVEFGVLAIWAHTHTVAVPYMKGLFKSFYVPKVILRAIYSKSLMLLLNEAMWSFGMAFLNQCYSVWGQDVNAALGISSTMFNMASVSFKSLGATVGIIMGQMLGANGEEKELRQANKRLIVLSLGFGTVFGGGIAALSGVFPSLFDTTASVRSLATGLILIASCDVLLQSYIYPVYFTLRSGGQTTATFLFDCGSIWVLSLPLAFLLSRYSNLHVFAIYGIVTGVDVIKCVVGKFMLRSGKWIHKLTVK